MAISVVRELEALIESTPISSKTIEEFSRILNMQIQHFSLLEILPCFQALYITLSESAEHASQLSILDDKIKSSYAGLIGLLPDAETPALFFPGAADRSLTHKAIRNFVSSFDLGLCGHHRVVVALPNGPTMGLACIAVATYHTLCPMTQTCGAAQFKADVQRVQASVILMQERDIEALKLKDATWICDAGIRVFVVEGRKDGSFGTKALGHKGVQIELKRDRSATSKPNTADDIAILLFTSGTSGTKKVVPITLHNLVVGVADVVKSWSLTKGDRCLNMMPLFHVGGLIRNLFAPLITGGSTICCSSFDPNLFWDLVESEGATWYYASPSMHAAILAEAPNRPDAVAKNKMSYGMTECMPIATPPMNYSLDRPGSSGVSAGPAISIRDRDNGVLNNGVVGKICVRGSPVFPGYLNDDNTIDTSAFTYDGWFDTGDLGFLDRNGYLYITGRSKEVINRGGEIISPFEVEEAILSASKDPASTIYNRVDETLAFSMPHDVLQEVVGVVLVGPNNKPRPSLDQVHDALRNSLEKTKWPVVLVYMDSLPRAKNKVLRIKLSARMDLPAMTDSTKIAHRYYEAVCPPPEASLDVKVSTARCKLNVGLVMQVMKNELEGDVEPFVCINEADGLLQMVVFGEHGCPNTDNLEKKKVDNSLTSRLQDAIHGYLIPKCIHFIPGPMPRRDDGTADDVAIEKLLRLQRKPSSISPIGAIETVIVNIFATILSSSPDDMDVETDFFRAGGDSLGAGKLLSMLRRQFNVRLSTETLFSNPKVSEIASLIDYKLAEREAASEGCTEAEKFDRDIPGCTEVHSSTNPLVLLLHLVPMVLVYPLRYGLWWTLFLYGMAEVSPRFPMVGIVGRLMILLLVMTAATVVVGIVAPLFGIIFKWILIGQYKEGLYPMWASYHNRWWLTQKTLQVCGRGVFSTSTGSLVLYYRLLGAKIGRNVIINDKAELGEYDLISIGDNVILDYKCICRPFAVERNTSMLLSPIRIGRNCTVGLSSIVAPGAVLLNDTCIGPNSSSWEINDASEKNRDLIISNLTPPHWTLELLIIRPVTTLAWLVRRGPWLAGLLGMVMTFPQRNRHDHEQSVARWYTATKRIGYHYLARVAGDSLGPVTFFLFVLLVKRILDSHWLCGPIRTGTPIKSRSQMQKLRVALLERLVPGGSLSQLAALFGPHYEIISILVRALGGRVGERVYWPGHGPTMQDFELLKIGNDVVFGSRSYLITSDQTRSAGITLRDGCMVADRVVVLPGTMVGERAILGSGALTRRDGVYPAGTVWIGSKAGGCFQLQHKSAKTHAAVPEEISKNSTAFGRAFYKGEADYYIIGLPSIISYSFLTVVLVSLYWNTAAIIGMKVVAIVLHLNPSGFHPGAWYRPLSIYALFTASIAIISTIQAILALALVVGAKWVLMGRRSPGSYNWDKSSYCQRWQILLTIERLRQKCYGGLGILNLLTGTHYMVLFFRALGGDIGEDCALFANGKPSLLITEPDLLKLGNRVAVDDASLVAHINSGGEFKLNRLHVGDRSVFRTGSRLLSGASVGDDACLLEHTLVMAGDHVESGDTYQGWPATLYEKKRV
ncbi:hypothetical protein N0V90_002330 [Kalmusia sp. IMI 367209]|nr:hypothetical protein N0V90_002330 [Kalmusia sp. IMI 367209]